MSQCKWRQFTKEQLEEIIASSKTKKEAIIKMGYSGHSSNCHVVDDIVDLYGFSIEHMLSPNRKEKMINREFGRLTVIDKDENKSGYYLCRCNCGNIVSIRGDHLINNKTKSCGCYRKEMPKIRDRIDLTNQTFGRLTVIKIDESRTDDVYWLCRCSCGNPNLKSILAYSLRSGHTKSCGCLKSKGEEKIIKALVDLNISFEQEKNILI